MWGGGSEISVYCGAQNYSVSGFIIFELFTVFFSRIGPDGEYLP